VTVTVTEDEEMAPRTILDISGVENVGAKVKKKVGWAVGLGKDGLEVGVREGGTEVRDDWEGTVVVGDEEGQIVPG
jgi:hypothetical protein